MTRAVFVGLVLLAIALPAAAQQSVQEPGTGGLKLTVPPPPASRPARPGEAPAEAPAGAEDKTEAENAAAFRPPTLPAAPAPMTMTPATPLPLSTAPIDPNAPPFPPAQIIRQPRAGTED